MRIYLACYKARRRYDRTPWICPVTLGETTNPPGLTMTKPPGLTMTNKEEEEAKKKAAREEEARKKAVEEY